MSATYLFCFDRATYDQTGYYITRWDQAVPISVVAATEPEARKAAAHLSGTAPRHRGWAFRVRSVEPAVRAEVRAAERIIAAREAERDALAAAVDRVRRRHPRGDEESGLLEPGKWCPTCGRERSDNGYGACPDRLALAHPSTDPDG